MKKNSLFVLGSCALMWSGTAFATEAPVSTVTILPPVAPAFEEMLAHVYQENPQLNAERENLRILDERVSEANAGFRPSLAINSEIGEARVSEASEAWRYGEDRNLALVATQPIYNAATIGQWDAARKRVAEGRARLLATEQKTLLTAITAWLDMCEKERLLNLDRDNNQLTQSYLAATQQRLAAGDGTQTDLALAQSRAVEGETRYAMALAARDAGRAAFERATGLHAQAGEMPPVPANLPVTSDEAVDLAKKNPELEQANDEVAATDDDIDTANGARWPVVSLRGMISEENASDLGLSRLRDDSITINASIPLYAGGGEYAHVREAKIAHEKSRFDALTVSRNVNEEAQTAWSHFHVAQSIIQSAEHAVEAANRARDGIEEEQKHGTRTLTEVLDAQAQALNARITALQAQSDLRLYAYRLMAAVGRLTAQDLNLPTKLYDPVTHYDDVASRWFGTSIDTSDRH